MRADITLACLLCTLALARAYSFDEAIEQFMPCLSKLNLNSVTSPNWSNGAVNIPPQTINELACFTGCLLLQDEMEKHKPIFSALFSYVAPFTDADTMMKLKQAVDVIETCQSEAKALNDSCAVGRACASCVNNKLTTIIFM